MAKIALGIVFVVGAFFAIVVYWLLKPFETEMISTANTSSTVNMTNYTGWVETVNYWPYLGWFVLLAVIGYGIYKVVKH